MLLPMVLLAWPKEFGTYGHACVFSRPCGFALGVGTYVVAYGPFGLSKEFGTYGRACVFCRPCGFA